MRDSTVDSERAASQLVGIVLMIAITVVIAGVLASGLLQFGTTPSKEAQAGAAIEWNEGTDSGSVTITYVARGNSEKLRISYHVEPAGNSVSVADGSTTLTEPGASVTLSEAPGNPDEDIEVRVTVVAFLDSGETVVVDEQTRTI